MRWPWNRGLTGKHGFGNRLSFKRICFLLSRTRFAIVVFIAVIGLRKSIDSHLDSEKLSLSSVKASLLLSLVSDSFNHSSSVD